MIVVYINPFGIIKARSMEHLNDKTYQYTFTEKHVVIALINEGKKVSAEGLTEVEKYTTLTDAVNVDMLDAHVFEPTGRRLTVNLRFATVNGCCGTPNPVEDLTAFNVSPVPVDSCNHGYTGEEVFSLTLYHNGANAYPVEDDIIYSADGLPYKTPFDELEEFDALLMENNEYIRTDENGLNVLPTCR